ncbi:MAG TPA: SMC-Scp complex subunit ScpB [Acidimicrobiia bacterium]
MNRRRVIEAVLFVAEEPIAVGELAELLEIPTADVEAELHSLSAELETGQRGTSLVEVAGGWRLYSHPEAREYLERFAATERAARLSSAALETLAVVAYRQPVSRGQVAELRGVDSERALRTLERRGLVAEVGIAAGPGQAILYGTTGLFLERLGVNTLAELPPLADHVPPAAVVDALERPFRPETSSSGSTS